MSLTGIDVHVHVHDERARALQGPEAQAKFVPVRDAVSGT